MPMMKTASESVTESAATQTANARMLVSERERQIGHVAGACGEGAGSMDR